MARRRRTIHGVYPIPTLFTSTSLIVSSVGIAALFDGGEVAALMCAVMILVAAVMDAMDGAVARATNSCSPFGVQFDSMADVVSFGVAPAWLMYVYSLKTFYIAGLAAAVFYLTCVAFRLARYNASAEGDTGGFSGLPSPPAAATVASFVILMETLPRFEIILFARPSQDMGMQQAIAPWAAVLMAGLGWLMVSRTPYIHVKSMNLTRPRPAGVVLAVLVFGYAVWALPQLLFPGFLLYALTGLLTRFLVNVRWAEVVVPAWVDWAERRLAGPRQATAPSKPGR